MVLPGVTLRWDDDALLLPRLGVWSPPGDPVRLPPEPAAATASRNVGVVAEVSICTRASTGRCGVEMSSAGRFFPPLPAIPPIKAEIRLRIDPLMLLLRSSARPLMLPKGVLDPTSLDGVSGSGELTDEGDDARGDANGGSSAPCERGLALALALALPSDENRADVRARETDVDVECRGTPFCCSTWYSRYGDDVERDGSENPVR